MPQLSPEQLEYSIQDLRDLQAIIGQRQQLLEQEKLTVEQTLIDGSKTAIETLKGVLVKQRLLLADNVTVGSIREWRARPIADRLTNKGQNDLANILIIMAQSSRTTIQQLLRQTKLTARDLGSAEIETADPVIPPID